MLEEPTGSLDPSCDSTLPQHHELEQGIGPIRSTYTAWQRQSFRVGPPAASFPPPTKDGEFSEPLVSPAAHTPGAGIPMEANPWLESPETCSGSISGRRGRKPRALAGSERLRLSLSGSRSRNEFRNLEPARLVDAWPVRPLFPQSPSERHHPHRSVRFPKTRSSKPAPAHSRWLPVDPSNATARQALSSLWSFRCRPEFPRTKSKRLQAPGLFSLREMRRNASRGEEMLRQDGREPDGLRPEELNPTLFGGRPLRGQRDPVRLGTPGFRPDCDYSPSAKERRKRPARDCGA